MVLAENGRFLELWEVDDDDDADEGWRREPRRRTMVAAGELSRRPRTDDDGRLLDAKVEDGLVISTRNGNGDDGGGHDNTGLLEPESVSTTKGSS